MPADDPNGPTRARARAPLVAVALLIAVIAIAAATLWSADNSGTNSLSGDPQSTTPRSPQVAP
jgi:hypothetical protein